MPKITQSKRTDEPASPRKRAAPDDDGIDLSLPTELSEPSDDLSAYHILIHGEKKIGKTTLAMQHSDDDRLPFLLTADPRQLSMRILQRHVPKWAHLLKYLKLLEKSAGKKVFPYSRVVVDGVDILATLCMKYVCAKLTVEHPQDAPYGKGWDALKTEFASVIDRFLALPCGVWFISHSKWVTVESRSGSEVTKLVPLMKGWAEETVVGKVDGWFAYDYSGRSRVLIVQGDERTGAGHRMDEHIPHFRVKGREDERVREVPMGKDSTTAYANLLRAFRNEQPFIDTDEVRRAKDKKGGRRHQTK